MPSLTFTFEPDMFISGVSPTAVASGSNFVISGSGVCSATGASVITSYGLEVPFGFETGNVEANHCVMTGVAPLISPHQDLTVRLRSLTSTGDYCCFEVTKEQCVHNCDVIITGDLTVSGDVGITGDVNLHDIPIGNDLTGFLVVDSNAGGVIKMRQVSTTGITGFDPTAVVLIAGSGLEGGGDLTTNRRFDVAQGSGIIVSNDQVNINTGFALYTGDAFFNVAPGPGLTGDVKVYMGDTLDLGVFVDNETIKFTGTSGNEIGAFSVIDGGITPQKVSFGFAGSNIKSGAANSVSGWLSGGMGIEDFLWSGDSKQIVNVDSSEVVMTTGDQDITGHKNFQGQVTIQTLEVLGLLTATGDGIYVSNLRVTGDVSGILADKTLSISGLNTTDRYSTSDTMSATPTQSEGVEVFNMEYAAQDTGNYLIIDTELNLASKDNCNAIVCIFKDDEVAPVRAWTTNIYVHNYGVVYRMKHFFQSPDIDLHNYKVRIGRRPTNGTSPILYVNRLYNYPNEYPEATGYLGQAAVSSLLISEIKPHPTGSRW